jgi:hypothetical protein
MFSLSRTVLPRRQLVRLAMIALITETCLMALAFLIILVSGGPHKDPIFPIAWTHIISSTLIGNGSYEITRDLPSPLNVIVPLLAHFTVQFLVIWIALAVVAAIFWAMRVKPKAD